MDRKRNIKKNIAILLVFCAVAVFAYFTIISSAHYLYDCAGQECVICHELQLAEGIVRILSVIGRDTGLTIFTVAILNAAMMSIACFLSWRTLITDKIRIDR